MITAIFETYNSPFDNRVLLKYKDKQSIVSLKRRVTNSFYVVINLITISMVWIAASNCAF